MGIPDSRIAAGYLKIRPAAISKILPIMGCHYTATDIVRQAKLGASYGVKVPVE